MPVTTTTVRIKASLADEAVKVLGAKSRADAVRRVLREIVAMKRIRAVMKNNSGRPKSNGRDE